MRLRAGMPSASRGAGVCYYPPAAPEVTHELGEPLLMGALAGVLARPGGRASRWMRAAW